jgi:ribosomal protein S18 acetylase RimI-like enzyme
MITYRKGKINDLNIIQELHSKLFEYEQGFEELYDLNYDKTEDSKQYFKSRLTSDNSFVYVAEENESIVGYICGAIGYEEFRKLHDVTEIDSLFVSEDIEVKVLVKN